MTIADSRVVGYIQPGALAALDLCRNDDHNGCAEVWIRPVSDESIALVHESLLAEAESNLADFRKVYVERKQQLIDLTKERNALQSRLDAVGRLTTELVALAKHHEIKADRPGTRSSDCQWHAGYDEGVSECVGRIRAALGCATTDGGERTGRKAPNSDAGST